MNDTGIAVVESTWWKKKNTSVRGLMDIIADIVVKTPHGYHYEMANSVEGLKKSIETLAASRNIRYLYLAMHGNDKGVVPHNGETASVVVLRNLLAKANARRASLRGLYLGCCSFGNFDTAYKLFEREISPTWIAGYSKSVDWMQSSILDMLFLTTLVSPPEKRIRETELQRIERVAGQIKAAAPGLVGGLGFGVFVRDADNGVRNLFEEPEYIDDLDDAA